MEEKSGQLYSTLEKVTGQAGKKDKETNEEGLMQLARRPALFSHDIAGKHDTWGSGVEISKIICCYKKIVAPYTWETRALRIW